MANLKPGKNIQISSSFQAGCYQRRELKSDSETLTAESQETKEMSRIFQFA